MLIIIGTVLCVAALVVDRISAWHFDREDISDNVAPSAPDGE